MTVDRTPDPENLYNSDRPAVVDVDGAGNVFVVAAKVRDNGWLWLKQWDGQTLKLPPHRVQAIQYIKTERYGEADKEGIKAKRVADRDWRRRAKEMSDETADEAAEAVVADD